MKKIVLIFLSMVMIATTMRAEVLINEFMSLNASGLQDEDGDYSDWIELYNSGDSAISLDGWALTDDPEHLSLWVLPKYSLGANQYLVIFASGKDRNALSAEFHTDFKLSGSGEYLALLNRKAEVVQEYAPYYPAQQTDVAYGLYLGQSCFLSQPTPGADNVLGDQILRPVFSVNGGLYQKSFELELSVADASFDIYYTLDGTRPTAQNALLYESPIEITTTTPVSAVCVNADKLAGEIYTQTYLFIKDVLNQPDSIGGYPMGWSYLDPSQQTPADYGMDQEVVKSADYQDMMEDAMTDIPSMCIVTNPDFLFSQSQSPDSGGIYIHTGKSVGGLGDGWERPASVEYYDPKTGGSFQINCGLLLHGGNSRNPSNSPKHSFRISFRKMYGASKLNYKIFEDKEATDRFDHLVLRAGYNYSWLKNGSKTLYPQNIVQRTNAQYIIDPFAKEAHRKMGQPITHRRFVHLYLNGIYWGLYDLCEKINNDFAQAYMGGSDEDYDVVGDHNEVFDGTDDIYKRMFDAAKKVGSSSDDTCYQHLITEQLLDIENYIDYMLVNYYIGNDDWDTNNWRVFRSRLNPKGGFRYLVWDAETAFTDVNIDKVKSKSGHPTTMMNALKKNPEFRLACADRIYKHMFNGGVLTPEGAAALYEELAQEIDKAIVAESARWGDYRQDVGDATEVYTRNDSWLVRKDDLLKNYFPKRTEILLQQLKDNGIYTTTVEPPVYSLPAGTYDDTVATAITAPKGDVYYTINGMDPREAFSGRVSYEAKKYVDSVIITNDRLIKSRVKSGKEWSPLAEIAYAIELPVLPPDTVVTPPDTVVTPPDTVITPPDTVVTPPDTLPQSIFQAPEALLVTSSCIDRSLYYTLPTDGVVRISIFRLDGKLVAVMDEHYMQAGSHQTPRIGLDAGMYLYRITFQGKNYVGKMVLP